MIEATIERIRQLVPELRLVGRAAEFQAAAENNPGVTPAVFVIQMTERPTPPATAGLLLQEISTSIGLIFVVKNLADTKGAAALADLEALRQKVRYAIYGWAPSEQHAPLWRGVGNLLAFRDGHVWWQDVFNTSYYDRSEL